MLQLRPNCEHCNKALLPRSTEAMICSYECTFCKSCVETVLENVCPNCGGGFYLRPIRPAKNWKNNNYLESDPASKKVVLSPVDVEKHSLFSQNIKKTLPEDR